MQVLGWEARMGDSERKTKKPDAMNALALLEKALTMLDEAEVPADVGAHLDLAICRLRECLRLPPPTSEGLDVDQA